MIIKPIFYFQNTFLISSILILNFSCDERNIHGDTLAEGIWAVTEIKGVDTTENPAFLLLPKSQIAFNICLGSMNDNWGSDHENYGDCSMPVTKQLGNQFTQDEYRFHILSDEALEIKRLEDHSDKMLPDLTGTYTYDIDERNMVMKYQGTDRSELRNLEIHCWDWEP